MAIPSVSGVTTDIQGKRLRTIAKVSTNSGSGSFSISNPGARSICDSEQPDDGGIIKSGGKGGCNPTHGLNLSELSKINNAINAWAKKYGPEIKLVKTIVDTVMNYGKDAIHGLQHVFPKPPPGEEPPIEPGALPPVIDIVIPAQQARQKAADAAAAQIKSMTPASLVPEMPKLIAELATIVGNWQGTATVAPGQIINTSA